MSTPIIIDATSTVWGVNHLALMNEAYASDYRLGGTETNFFKANNFSNHIKKIKYPNYYTTIESNNGDTPWIAQTSIGRLFKHNGLLGSESILFTRFYNSSREIIVRSPISPISILEASAMSQELSMDAKLLTSISTDQRAVEERLYSNIILGDIYSKKLTEYSVCVHLVANQQQSTDILQTFMLTALISRIVLNSTASVFRRAARHGRISELLRLQKGHSPIEPFKRGLEQNNMGVLFYFITAGLPRNSFTGKAAAIEGVSYSLARLGLDLEYVKNEARQHIERVSTNLKSSRFRSIATLSEVSPNNFNIIGLSEILIPFEEVHLPKVMLGDGSESSVFENSKNELLDFELEACFNELVPGQSWVSSFSEGCI